LLDEFSTALKFLYELLASKVLPTARSAGSSLREPSPSKALAWRKRLKRKKKEEREGIANLVLKRVKN